jgi:hypothetical protein
MSEFFTEACLKKQASLYFSKPLAETNYKLIFAPR